MQSTKKRLAGLGNVAMIIEQQQLEHPGYMEETLNAMVNSELRKLAEEQARFDAGYLELAASEELQRALGLDRRKDGLQ